MPSVTITAPDGKTLTVPFSGSPPSQSDMGDIVDHYMATKGRSASAPATTPTGTPTFDMSGNTPAALAQTRAMVAAQNAPTAPTMMTTDTYDFIKRQKGPTISAPYPYPAPSAPSHPPVKGQTWDEGAQAYVPNEWNAPPPDQTGAYMATHMPAAIAGMKKGIANGESPMAAALKYAGPNAVSALLQIPGLAAIGKEMGPKPDAFSGRAAPGMPGPQDTVLPDGSVINQQYADSTIRQMQDPIDPEAWRKDPAGTALATLPWLLPFLPKGVGALAAAGKGGALVKALSSDVRLPGAVGAPADVVTQGQPRTFPQPPQPGFHMRSVAARPTVAVKPSPSVKPAATDAGWKPYVSPFSDAEHPTSFESVDGSHIIFGPDKPGGTFRLDSFGPKDDSGIQPHLSSSEHPTLEAAKSAAGNVTVAQKPAELFNPTSEPTPEPVPSTSQPVGKFKTTQDVADAFHAAQPALTTAQVAGFKAVLDAHAADWAETTGLPAAEYAASVWHDLGPGKEPVQAPAEPVESPIAITPSADYSLPNGNTTVPTSAIHADPARFQYKIGYGQGGVASSSDVGGADVYDRNRAGVLDVWRDPADNKTYVVNGHNRLARANRDGIPMMDVRYMEAADADEARTIGALNNIAQGQGTPFDAAKLFRDKGASVEDMRRQGINFKGKMAEQGAGLANLSPDLFAAALHDRIPLERAVLIGSKLHDYADQAALMKSMGKRNITNGQLSELIDSVQNAPRHTTSENTLFGDVETKQNLAFERAEVADYIGSTLRGDSRALKGAADNADRIEQVEKNTIDAETTRALADETNSAYGVFQRLKNSSGEVSDILNAAARRLSDKKENRNRVKADALKQYRKAVEQYVKSSTVAPRERIADAVPGTVREDTPVETGPSLFQRDNSHFVPVDIPALDLAASRKSAQATSSMFDETPPAAEKPSARPAPTAKPKQLGFQLHEEGSMKGPSGNDTGTLFHDQGSLGAPKGSVTFRPEDGKAIVRMFKASDISTGVHEVAHIWRRTLSADKLATFENHYGVEDGHWTEAHEEQFARDFEKYLADGKAPKPSLQAHFDNFKAWLGRIYASAKNSPLKGEMHPDLRDAFDRMMGRDRADVAETSQAAKPAEPDMIGSLNPKTMALTPRVEANLRDAAARLGLENKEIATDEDAANLAKSLNLSYADMKDWTPGDEPKRPDNVTPKLWTKAWGDAVANLHGAAQRDLIVAQDAVADAQERYDAKPTVANQKALDAAKNAVSPVQTTADMMHVHDDALSAKSGAALQGRKDTPVATRGSGYQQALQSVPTLDEALGKPMTAPAKSGPVNEGGPVRPSVPRPSKVRTVDEDARQQALATLKGQQGPTTLFQRGDTDFNDLPDPKQAAAVTLGKFHYEAGNRAFPAWQAAMEKDLGRKMTSSEAHKAYYMTKGAIAQDVNAKQVAAATPLFKDQLKELGREGAAQFAHDIDPVIFDKIVQGKPVEAFTTAERAEIAKVYADNTPERNKGATPVSQLAVKAIVHDAKMAAGKPLRVAQGKALVAKRAAQKAAEPPADPFDVLVGRRVTGGQKTATAIREDLEGDAIGQSAVTKLIHAPDSLNLAESQRLARAIDAQKRVNAKPNPTATTERLTKLMRDARTGKLGLVTGKDLVRQHFLDKYTKQADEVEKNTGKKVDADAIAAKMAPIDADLAKIKNDDDYGAIKEVVNKWGHDTGRWGGTFAQNFGAFYRGNLLSNSATLPGIFASHVLSNAWEKAVVDPGAALLDTINTKVTGQPRVITSTAKDAAASRHAVKQGLQSAGRVLRSGENAEVLRGDSHLPHKGLRGEFNVGLDKVADKIKNPTIASAVRATGAVINTPWRIWNRQHAAVFNLAGVPIYDNALRDAARLHAVNEGLKGADQDARASELYNAPTTKIEDAAARNWEEKMFTNKNEWADFVGKLNNYGAAGKVVGAILQPFANIPANIAGRAIEATPVGIIKGLSILRKGGENITPVERANAYRSIVRSIGGAATVYVAYKYMNNVNAINQKDHRYSPSVDAFGRRTEIGRLAPSANSIGVGRLLKEKGLQGIMSRDFLESVAGEGPYMNLLTEIDNTFSDDSGTKKPLNPGKITANSLATGLIPGGALLNAIAASGDPTGNMRRKDTGLDVIANKIPGPPIKIVDQAITRQGLDELKVQGGQSVPELGGLKFLRSASLNAFKKTPDQTTADNIAKLQDRFDTASAGHRFGDYGQPLNREAYIIAKKLKQLHSALLYHPAQTPQIAALRAKTIVELTDRAKQILSQAK